MGFTKISTVSLTDLFIQQIENMILSGELAVGSQLPPARELSVKLGVSRPVISAGLAELEKLGFVEIVPRQGVYVCDYRRKGSMETLVAIMRYNHGAMRQDEVRALLEVRYACECLCLKLVLEKNGPEELEKLEPIVEAIQETSDPEEAAEHVFEFHHELAVLSGNAILPLFYYSFREQGLYLWSMYCRKSGTSMMYDIKTSLLSALLNGDLDSAIKQTETVLNNAVDDLKFYGA